MTAISPQLDGEALRNLFEAGPHPSMVLAPDADLTILAVNRRFLAVLGRSGEELVGKPLSAVFPETSDDEAGTYARGLRASLQRVLRDHRVDVLGVQKIDLPQHKGSRLKTRYFSPISVPIMGAGQKVRYLLHCVEDVTEFIRMRKAAGVEVQRVGSLGERMESEVLSRTSELVEANLVLKDKLELMDRRDHERDRIIERLHARERTRVKFLSNLVLEVRSPLSHMLRIQRELLDRVENVPGQKVLADGAYRDGLSLMKLANGALDLLRIESGRVHPMWQATDVVAFTRELIEPFRPVCEHAGLELIVKMDTLTHPIELDRNMWEQVVLNLLSNAVKYTLEGSIEVSLEAVDDQLELKVRDTGSGIAESEFARLFERFHQGPTRRGRSDGGSGLGLALVREYLHLLDGEVKVESQQGHGSCFTAQLPLSTQGSHKVINGVAHQHALTRTSTLAGVFAYEAMGWLPQDPIELSSKPGLGADESAEPEKSRGHVLIADDDADMRSFMKQLLQDAGYTVTAVEDGLAALAACRKTASFDMLISDVDMPGLDGMSLVHKLRTEQSLANLPIILLTANDDALIEGLKSGADECLSKLLPASELIARVSSALDLARIRRGNEMTLRRVTQQLEQERSRLCEAQAIAKLGYVEIDLKTNILSWSDEASRIYGADFIGQEDTLEALLKCVHPDDRESVTQALDESISGHHDVLLEHRVVLADESVSYVQLRWRVHYGPGNEPMRVVGIAQDITDRHEVEESMRAAMSVFSSTDEGIVVTDSEGRVTAVNPAFTRITGYTSDDVLGRNPRYWGSGRHSSDFFKQAWHSLRRSGQWHGEIWNRRKNGELFPCWQNISVVPNKLGGVSEYVAIFSDISTVKQAEERLTHLAHHDVLTGLPNRMLLTANLELALERAKRHGRHLALFILDLDRFKLINDTLGHAAGDELLQEVGRRLRSCARAEDTVARLGGDEFAVIVNDLAHPRDARPIAAKIIEAIAQPLDLAGGEITTSTSLGIGLYPDDADSCNKLLEVADAAMYRAKAQGRNTFDYYTDELSSIANESQVMERALRHALANDELMLRFQPLVTTDSGQIVGVEALLRWQHPERGLLLPHQFIRVAEQSGLIDQVGKWVINAVLVQAKEWKAAGITPPRISINISAREILYNNLANSLAAAINRNGSEDVKLELEINESVLEHFDRSVKVFQRLKGCGASIAIDDFGTGYSSLSRLKNLPVDTLKVDRSFVRGLPNGTEDKAFTEAIVSLGHSLGMRVVAEGVENREQFNYLRDIGCDEVQGFFVSMPVTAEAMANMLSAPTVH